MADIAAVIAFGESHNACNEAMDWLRRQTDPDQAWQDCERADWMIWFAHHRRVDRKTLVRIACACACTALPFVSVGEDRPRLAIEATERWLIGEATIEEVRSAYAAAAANAAYAVAYAANAANAASAYAAAAAAYAAAYANAAANAAAYAADAAANAAYAAAAYAADAAADAARHHAHLQMCAIVRQHISYQDIAL